MKVVVRDRKKGASTHCCCSHVFLLAHVCHNLPNLVICSQGVITFDGAVIMSNAYIVTVYIKLSGLHSH